MNSITVVSARLSFRETRLNLKAGKGETFFRASNWVVAIPAHSPSLATGVRMSQGGPELPEAPYSSRGRAFLDMGQNCAQLIHGAVYSLLVRKTHFPVVGEMLAEMNCLRTICNPGCVIQGLLKDQTDEPLTPFRSGWGANTLWSLLWTAKGTKIL